MTSPYPLDEQETTINVFPAVISNKAEIYTCIPHMIQLLRKLCEEYPDEVTIIEHDGYIDATVPRSWIKVQPKRKCTLSDEQKKANAERLASYRTTKKGAVKT